MHRFRKKSDAKRAQVPEQLIARSHSRSPQPTVSSHNSSDPLPALPPVTDFRTSLILPSLSRRFTLLRASNGDPVSLEDIRSKIAEQRSRGAEHQIFEEEEDMIVNALAQLRAPESPSPIPPAPSNTAVAHSSGGTFAAQQDMSVNLSNGGESGYPSFSGGNSPSISSTLSPSYPRSPPSSPSASRTSGSPRYSSKRMSNNMFASGRLHDTNYLRSVSKSSTPSSRSTASLTGSESHGGSVRSTLSTRGADVSPSPPDPDASGDSSTSPEKLSSAQNGPLSPYSPVSAVPSRLAKDFSLQQVRRTSLALEEVIRGIEEEVEEETIMVPRTSLSRAGTVNSRAQSPKVPDTPSTIGTPIPWMTDEARVDDRDDEEISLPIATQPRFAPVTVSPSPSPSPGPYHRPGTTSPTPRLPGYIPGMTRPLTPRDAESDRDDGATGYSTTPRARSPALPQFSHHSSGSHTFSSSRHHHHTSLSSDGLSILPPSILRPSRASGQQAVPLRTASPGYGGRSRGNSTSSPQIPSPVPSPAPDERFKSDLLMRRPLSPLIGTQTSTYGGGSRPATPSSPGPWAPSSPLAQVHTIPSRENDNSRPGTPAHTRNDSFVSADSVAMPLSSPALPDSPLMGGRQGNVLPLFGWEHMQGRNGDVNTNNGNEGFGQLRPSAVAAKIAARAPTPVHTHSRTPSASESGHEPIFLHRTVSRRSQKRMQSPTPPPQVLTQAPMALHTPSSSSNSSNLNVNMNVYAGPSPLFSPMLNTSASSLVSVGSSYHSWIDENGNKSRWDQLVDYDSQRSAWQDILNTGGRGVNHTDDASESLNSPDKELHSLTGLTKGDLITVQSKLVADAQARRGFEPPRSPTRRRRMSTSRASYSAAQPGRESGTNSPAPAPRQPTPVAENGNAAPVPRHSPDNTSRANALLDSVLNSIQSQTASSTPPSSDVPTAEPASTTDDDSSSRFPSISSSGRESREEDSSALRLKALADALSVPEQSPPIEEDRPATPPAPEQSQSPEEDSGEATEVPAHQLWRSPQPPLHRSPNDAVQLVRDVSRKAAAATAALKSPSQANVAEPDGTLRRRGTKRIDLQKISSPHLVSSSTSVDAVPIAPAQASSPAPAPASKLSQRFKRLRGTLRTKPTTPNGDEVHPFSLPSPTSTAQSAHSTSSVLRRLPSPVAPAQTARYMPPMVPLAPASATEPGTFKVPVSPAPASAGPGLKSFILGRFRRGKKESENTGNDRPGHHSSQSTSPVSPHDRDIYRGRNGPVSPSPGSGPSPPTTSPRRSQDGASAERTRSPTPDAVAQLFTAGIQLGLDQNALNELFVSRSMSTSSRKTAQAPAPTVASTRPNPASSRVPVPRSREPAQSRSFDRPRTPDQVVYRPPARPTPANRPPEGEIVRRTIIFASDNPSLSELSALVRKNSTAGGRPQRSDSSVSLHSTTSGTQPPVPKLPASLASPKGANESSFYDMYSPDQSFSSVQNGGGGDTSGNLSPVPGENIPAGEQGQGPALELLQLSNGQVIWSVLDSLRAEDEEDSESLFRRSMASSRGEDDLEVRFKEHRRYSSKGSNYSQASQSSRRRPVPAANGSRPETKLFKTNSLTIGRLIEDLSKNLDSGSFNFMRPATATGTATTPSTSTSFHSDASGSTHQVERDLDALLNVINNPR